MCGHRCGSDGMRILVGWAGDFVGWAGDLLAHICWMGKLRAGIFLVT
jgi:hypothetical protein